MPVVDFPSLMGMAGLTSAFLIMYAVISNM